MCTCFSHVNRTVDCSSKTRGFGHRRAPSISCSISCSAWLSVSFFVLPSITTPHFLVCVWEGCFLICINWYFSFVQISYMNNRRIKSPFTFLKQNFSSPDCPFIKNECSFYTHRHTWQIWCVNECGNEDHLVCIHDSIKWIQNKGVAQCFSHLYSAYKRCLLFPHIRVLIYCTVTRWFHLFFLLFLGRQ